MAQIKSKFIKDGAITDAKVSTGIDAAKLGDGSVSNAELQSLGGVTSDIQTQLDAKIANSEKGAVSGVATLNASGKLSSSQVPALAITSTFTAATIAARDALTVGVADGEIQEGDVVVVTDASADVNVTSGAASYIYDGTVYKQLLTPDSPVQSVNGGVGVVVLDTDDVAEGATNKYYTEVRVSANSDVTANTAKVSADGSVATHSDVTDAGSGIIISDVERTKLNGIEAAATADQTGAEIKVAYEAEADTNAFTDAEQTKLTGVEAGATADQSSAEVVYDNTISGLTATDVKSALDEIVAASSDDQTAAEVSFSNATSGLTATDVQAAIDEVEGRVDTLEAASAPQSASEVFTLIAGDITAEAVTLTNSPRGASATVSVDGIVQTPGVDYSISGSSLRFGDVADAGLTASDLDPTSGAAALIIGDIMVVKYEF